MNTPLLIASYAFLIRSCFGRGTSLSPVIPVPVTGIQRAASAACKTLLLVTRLNESFHGADAPWLDSCDKHRNDGG